MIPRSLLAGTAFLLAGAMLFAEEFAPYDLRADPAAVADGIPKDLKSGTFTLWLPPGHAGKRIRGIISVVDYQDGVGLWKDTGATHMRAELDRIMTEHDLGMMLEYVCNFDSERKLYKNPENDWAARASFHALNHYATTTGHPELAHAPLLWTGLSQSGGTAYLKSRLAPQRTIGAIAYHAATAAGDYAPAFGVPILSPLGDKDALSARSFPLYTAHVPAGALWLPFIQDGTPHHRLDGKDEHSLVYAWIRWVIAARLPPKAAASGPVTLQPLDPAKGYHVVGGFTGSGQGSTPVRYQNLVVSPAGAKPPADAIGWIPDASLLDIWVEQAQPVTVGQITRR